jgi:hypothetical protein
LAEDIIVPINLDDGRENTIFVSLAKISINMPSRIPGEQKIIKGNETQYEISDVYPKHLNYKHKDPVTQRCALGFSLPLWHVTKELSFLID